MEFTVRYASTRTEVWQLYLRNWKRRLWIIHLALFVVGTLILMDRMRGTGTVTMPILVKAALLAAVPLGVLAVFPMLAFKPQTRTLTLDTRGWRSSIGTRQGSRSWKDIAAVDDTGGGIVIESRNGNALIVPDRAFATPAERQHFLEFATAAQHGANA